MSKFDQTTHLLLCPSCGATNRLPGDRRVAAASCGACQAPLLDGRPIAVDEAGFERHLGRDTIPLLVDVWAPWCGPCRAMAPAFDAAGQAFGDEVRLLKLNIDEAPETAQRFGIQSVPALLLFSRGRLIAQSAGARDSRGIQTWARAHLSTLPRP